MRTSLNKVCEMDCYGYTGTLDHSTAGLPQSDSHRLATTTTLLQCALMVKHHLLSCIHLTSPNALAVLPVLKAPGCPLNTKHCYQSAVYVAAEHLQQCLAVPEDILEQDITSREARSDRTQQSTTRQNQTTK